MANRAVAAGAYALYLLHTTMTLFAAARPSRRLPPDSALGAALGTVSSLSGLWLYAAGVRRFRSFEQISGLEEGQLVTGGVYRYTRNPQIVGWGLALLGAAFAGRSVKALVLVAFYFAAHRLYFPVEERQLELTFGEEYRRYRAEVPRFLGLPKDS